MTTGRINQVTILTPKKLFGETPMNKGRAVSIAERMLNAISNLEVVGAEATTTSYKIIQLPPLSSLKGGPLIQMIKHLKERYHKV
jgi:hypothetical protein